MRYLIHTDFGHDPDDAVAISYLMEQECYPHTIGITPGHIQQIKSLSGLINSYDIDCPSCYISQNKQFSEKFTVGKHSIFNDNSCLNYELAYEKNFPKFDKVLIIGPPKNIGDKIECKEMFFQGGYSPNTIYPLEKFKGKVAVQSFNPSGAKNSFNELLYTKIIKRRYYVGKNVCHGFTKRELSKIWEPKNKKVKQFWDKLKPTKAMHDVLAAILFLNKDLGIWEQAMPTWIENKLTTMSTDMEIYTLIGLKT